MISLLFHEASRRVEHVAIVRCFLHNPPLSAGAYSFPLAFIFLHSCGLLFRVKVVRQRELFIDLITKYNSLIRLYETNMTYFKSNEISRVKKEK